VKKNNKKFVDLYFLGVSQIANNIKKKDLENIINSLRILKKKGG